MTTQTTVNGIEDATDSWSDIAENATEECQIADECQMADESNDDSVATGIVMATDYFRFG